MTDSFVFYRSFYEAAKDLSDSDRLAVFDAVCEYALNDSEIEGTAVSKGMMKLIKPQLDANKRKRLNGALGGRPKGNQIETKAKPKDNLTESKAEPNVNVNVNANVNGNVNVNKGFKKPTIEEVREYCRERNNNVDPDRWYNYYSSNGWKVGKNPMKDWRAAIRTWERGSYNKPTTSRLPVYDTSHNATMTAEEENELLALMKGRA